MAVLEKKVDIETALEAEIVKQANEAVVRGQTHIRKDLKRKAQEYLIELEEAAFCPPNDWRSKINQRTKHSR